MDLTNRCAFGGKISAVPRSDEEWDKKERMRRRESEESKERDGDRTEKKKTEQRE